MKILNGISINIAIISFTAKSPGLKLPKELRIIKATEKNKNVSKTDPIIEDIKGAHTMFYYFSTYQIHLHQDFEQ